MTETYLASFVLLIALMLSLYALTINAVAVRSTFLAICVLLTQVFWFIIFVACLVKVLAWALSVVMA
jgi:hypothetical protein